MARRPHRPEDMAAKPMAGGGLIASRCLLLLHVVYVTLSYRTESSSAETTKAFFIGTILGVPIFGLGVAVAIGNAAHGAADSRLLPAWWAAISGIGATLAAVAVISYPRLGFVVPDVQQQVVANVFLWLLVTAATLAKRQPAGIRQRSPTTPTGRVLDRRMFARVSEAAAS